MLMEKERICCSIESMKYEKEELLCDLKGIYKKFVSTKGIINSSKQVYVTNIENW